MILCSAYAMSVGATHYGSFDSIDTGIETPTLIRMHVIANSDLPSDQKLKLLVRDEVMSALANSPIALKDLRFDEALEVMESALPLIERTAQERLLTLGVEQDVTVRFGPNTYSERVYLDQVIPAGEYISLEIVLGSGGGQNFWCILFPGMCFVPEEVQQLTAERSRGNVAEAAPVTVDDSEPKGRPVTQFRWLLLDRLLGKDPGPSAINQAAEGS